MTWLMTFVRNSFNPNQPKILKEFDTYEDGLAWLREEAPDLLRKGVWSIHAEGWHQHGTNNRWATFQAVE